MNKTFTQRLLIFLTLFLFGHLSFAQIVGADVYLQGQYAEVGISSCGKFGTEITAPPLGPYGAYHPNIGTTLGFVSDAGKNGWGTAGPAIPYLTGGTVTLPNYCGDYFRPGTPEEGFVVRVNGTNYINNGSSGCAGAMIPGSVTDYAISASMAKGTWVGNIAVPGGTVTISAETTVKINKTYFVTIVTITNNSPNPITDVYYMRTLDPDNDQPWSGDFTTRHRITNRPTTPVVTPADCYANVSSQGGAAGGTNSGCYLALGAKDSRARAAFGGFTNTDPVAIWDGTGGFTNTLGATGYADEGNSLSIKIGTMAASTSTTVGFAYCMSEAELTEALDATAESTIATADGADISYTSGTNLCEGSAVTLNVSGVAGYNWVWSPGTYLNTTTGATVICTMPAGGAGVTYTVTGTSPCNPTVVRTITVNPTAPAPTPLMTPTTIYCEQKTTLTAAYNTTGLPAGTVTSIDWWSAVSGGALLADNSLTYTTPFLYSNTTYYADQYSFTAGSGGGVLPYDETFEQVIAATTYTTDQIPVPATGMSEWSWDVITGSARMRIGAPSITATEGMRCLTLDRNGSGAASSGEAVIQLNLGGYSSATDLTLQFNYLKHGAMAAGDFMVQARKSTASAWINVVDVSTLPAVVGTWGLSPVYDLDALLGVGGFGTDFQVRFRVNSVDNAATAMATLKGLSIDAVKIRGTENIAPRTCRSTRVPVTVTVNPLPLPTATTSYTICSGASQTMTATKTTGLASNLLQWYNAAAGGTLLATGSPYSVTPATTTTYYVQETSPLLIDQTYNFVAGSEGWTAGQGCTASAWLTPGTWSWGSDGGTGAMISLATDYTTQELRSPIYDVTREASIGANIELSFHHRSTLFKYTDMWGWTNADCGMVVYRFGTGSVGSPTWGTWQKFTPTTFPYNTLAHWLNVDPYLTAISPWGCSSSSQDVFSGTYGYTTSLANITVPSNAVTMEVVLYADYDWLDPSNTWYAVPVTTGSWYVDWVRLRSLTTGPLCVGPRRAVTVNVASNPTNNNFCNAATASVGYNSFYSNRCANAQASEPSTPTSCFRTNGGTNAGVSHSVWFRFTSPVTQVYGACIYYGTDAANVPTGGQFDSEMAMYSLTSGSCATNANFTGAGPITLTQIACNDDGALVPAIHGPWGVRSAFNCGSITAGTTRYFQVDGAWRVAAGTKGARMDAFPGASESDDFVLHIFPITLLDVDWVKFTGKSANNGNLLEWITANEYGTKEFEVQRSTNGKTFSSIGKVTAKGGVNNNYAFTDSNPLARSYYRLREVGIDGKEHFSKVIVLDKSARFGILSISPNPARDVAEVQYTIEEAATVKLELFDAIGRLMLSSEINATVGVNSTALNVATLANGNYVLSLTSGTHKATGKLVKK